MDHLQGNLRGCNSPADPSAFHSSASQANTPDPWWCSYRMRLSDCRSHFSQGGHWKEAGIKEARAEPKIHARRAYCRFHMMQPLQLHADRQSVPNHFAGAAPGRTLGRTASGARPVTVAAR